MTRQRIAIICVAIVGFAVCVVAAHHHDGTDFRRSCAICTASKIAFNTTNSSPDVFQFWITYVSAPETALTPPVSSATPGASRAPPLHSRIPTKSQYY
jgi:hypothetical protein